MHISATPSPIPATADGPPCAWSEHRLPASSQWQFPKSGSAAEQAEWRLLQRNDPSPFLPNEAEIDWFARPSRVSSSCTISTGATLSGDAG